MKRKGILLAAGKGTRMHPVTLAVSKLLIPIYDKPMIFYPLSLFLHAGIQDILIIVDPEDLRTYKTLLGDGSRFGAKISYEVQIEKRGIADAFIIGETFLDNHPCLLILGDNLLHSHDIDTFLKKADIKNTKGATIFGYQVPDPERFGVVTFDDDGKVTHLEEKPSNPKSSYAIPGIYFYDTNVVAIAKKLQPSDRGELEITDVNKEYLKRGELSVVALPGHVFWFDTGTYDALLEASLFVQKIQKETGEHLAHLESIAHHYHFINDAHLKKSADLFSKASYGKHMLEILSKKEKTSQ